MRIAAALILTLASSVALADEPRSVIYYGDEQGFTGNVADGNDRVRQPTTEGASNQAIAIWDYERLRSADPNEFDSKTEPARSLRDYDNDGWLDMVPVIRGQ